ncbi:MAG: MerR family transcriptional regulator [Thermomicrobiales bacterium]
MTAPSPTMTLADLTEAADVSTRTVRYYIAEGLLPPPEGAGPSSVYTAGHLARLRLIQRLKAAYWPLKEIRRRLAGLSDAEVERALLEMDFAPEEAPAHADAAMAPARDYLAVLEQRAVYRAERLPLHELPATAPAASFPAAPHPAAPRHDEVLSKVNPLPDVDAGSLWRRVPLGEDAELVISERAYTRHRERIEWLIRWARKVFA